MNEGRNILDRKINKIFDKCIILLCKGYDIDYCLNKFKKYRDDLQENLRIYEKLKKLEDIELDKNFLENTLDKIYNLSAEKVDTFISKPPKKSFMFKPAMILLAALVIISFSFVGVLFASQNSVPNEILYSFKRAIEQIKLSVYPESSIGSLHFDLLSNRLHETNKIIESNLHNKEITDNLLSEIEYEYGQSKKYNYIGSQIEVNILNNIESIKSKYQKKYGQVYQINNRKEIKVSNVDFAIEGPVYLQEQDIFYYRVKVKVDKENSNLSVEFNRDDCNGAWGPYVAQVNLNPEEKFVLTVTIPSLYISKSFTLVGLHGPATSNVIAMPNPVAVNNSVTITANIDDTAIGGFNIDSAEYSLDDGNSWVQLKAFDGKFDDVSENVSSDFNADTPGVFNLLVRGIDVNGNIGDPVKTKLVVYDPENGFVIGDGWINSPEGAYTADTFLTGKATFSFVSKYLEGDTVPTGNIDFKFEAANLYFSSSRYNWLAITMDGTDSEFNGTGTVNGEGNYSFVVWSTNNTPDTFHIKIWLEEDGKENIIYDNFLDQYVNNGSIKVRKEQ
jgi:hypothetical protein